MSSAGAKRWRRCDLKRSLAHAPTSSAPVLPTNKIHVPTSPPPPPPASSPSQADIIVATPEKWDSITRRLRDNAGLVGQVRRFVCSARTYRCCCMD